MLFGKGDNRRRKLRRRIIFERVGNLIVGMDELNLSGIRVLQRIGNKTADIRVNVCNLLLRNLRSARSAMAHSQFRVVKKCRLRA